VSGGGASYWSKLSESRVTTAVHFGWPEPYIHTVYDRMYGDFPAKNTVYTPYIPINEWFWPTLLCTYQGGLPGFCCGASSAAWYVC